MSDIKINKITYPDLTINFDQVDFDVIVIIDQGEKFTLPSWEFRQLLKNGYKENENN